jgi:hypothetical protein
MATVTVSYSAATTITCGVASLASSSTFVAGRESDQVDNTSNKYVDALLQGKITVGTTPTVNTQIGVWVWGSHTSLATTARDVLDGTDSAETLTSEGIRDSFLVQAAAIRVDATTSDRTYEFGPVGLASLFGGALPQFWGVFVAHNTGVALNATGGNHEFKYTGVKYDVA